MEKSLQVLLFLFCSSFMTNSWFFVTIVCHTATSSYTVKQDIFLINDQDETNDFFFIQVLHIFF